VDQMTEIMLDLETMSTHPNASIVSIGAVRFMPPSAATAGSVTDATFYVNVALPSCMDAGLHVESRTVAWWELQSKEARDALGVDTLPLNAALLKFSQWFGEESRPVWANPATFDLVILASAYRAVNMTKPWEFYDERCYRTIRSLFPTLPYVKPGVPHHALEDAVAQAHHLIKILKELHA